jgi:uncharacterized protein involved in tellurium resistance
LDLKQKGDNAVIGSFKQLKVSLIWTSGVDLDLMAFYKTKDGKVGGVYSDNYAGGMLGNLNAFPFIQLSGDAGVDASAGDNREVLRIAHLDDFEELCIVALNFTDASSGSGKVFADYDAHVEVVTDKGESHKVALDSKQTGSVAILCKFKKDFMGASLVNNREVMTFEALQEAVSGASAIKLASKIVLKQKGDKTNLVGKDFHAKLTWKAAVDLDLHCFYQLKSDYPEPEKGLIGKLLGGSKSRGEGQVYFGNRGSKTNSPWIYLDQDAGIGDVGGDNEENLYFTKLDQIKQALIAVNIYSKPNANFASYDGKIFVQGGGREIEIALTEKQPGSWCVIAQIDNTDKRPQLININQIQKHKPEISQFA